MPRATRSSARARRSRTSSASPEASPSGRAPRRASCRRCWPSGPRTRVWISSRRTAFCYPNAVLESRGLLSRKGFPESYDVRRLLEFVIDVKSGKPNVKAPVYSHLTYDIVPGAWQEVNRPDVMILEGLNVLQTAPGAAGAIALRVGLLRLLDLHRRARRTLIEQWYVDRFMTLRETVFTDAKSYFHRYASLTDSRSARDRIAALARDQLPEPEREHRADARARALDPREETPTTTWRACGCGSCKAS